MEDKFNANVVLDIAMEIGVNLLRSGAEISRVEETIGYICKSYGAISVDVFAIPTLIVATIEYEGETYTSKIKRNLDVANDLYRIEKYNQLSRDICSKNPTLEEVKKAVLKIQAKKDYNLFLLYVGALFSAFGFALFFGGSILDSIAAGIVGVVTFALTRISFFSNQKMLKILFCSLVGGLLSVLLCFIHVGQNVSYVMIGGVMILIPGIYISTSIKDIIYGDTLSGSIRLLQAFILSLTIAAGFSVWILVFNFDIKLNDLNPWWMTMIASLIGTLGFSIIFNAKYNRLTYLAIGGLLTCGVYLLSKHFFNTLNYDFLPTLLAAITGALFCEIFARILKAPTVCLLLPTIIILVPGLSLFFTLTNLLEYNQEQLIYNLMNTVLCSLAIALGMVICQFMAQIIHQIVKNIKIRKKKKHEA